MTETNIEKLNSALTQLIEAYEKLQRKNENLENTIEELNETVEALDKDKDTLTFQRDDLEAKNKDLEFKLSDYNSSSEQQENKMDGMLSKIQSLLVKSDLEEKENDTVKETTVDTDSEDLANKVESLISDNNADEDDDLNVLDLKLDDTMGNKKEEPKPDSEYDKTKIDLGRMESLLNGLNK